MLAPKSLASIDVPLSGHIAKTIKASYHSLTLESAATLLFFKPTQTSSLIEFCKAVSFVRDFLVTG